jgi:hypothetical protein
LYNQVSADEIRGGAVCQKKIEVNETAARAAAVAEYVGKEVLICGGRNRDSEVNEVSDVITSRYVIAIVHRSEAHY